MRLAVDTHALAAYLAGLGIEGPVSARQFSGGQSNPTYRLDTGSGAFVLRRKPPGKLLPRAHMIEREHRVMAALWPTPVPVPRMVALCEDESVIGSVFFVMELVEGRVVFDTQLPGETPEARRATYAALTDTLADLHDVDVESVGLGDFGRHGGYLARQLKVWQGQYQASATRGIPAMDRLAGWLPGALAGIPDETCLVHGDYRLDNAILSPEAPEVLAVLDWELSTLGHPLSDLAYFLMTWLFPADLRHGLADIDRATLGIPELGEMAARYAARTGRAEIGGLRVLLAFSIWRMAAIIQGVHARGLAGNAADEAALGMGADVGRLAEIALEIAEGARDLD